MKDRITITRDEFCKKLTKSLMKLLEDLQVASKKTGPVEMFTIFPCIHYGQILDLALFAEDEVAENE